MNTSPNRVPSLFVARLLLALLCASIALLTTSVVGCGDTPSADERVATTSAPLGSEAAAAPLPVRTTAEAAKTITASIPLGTPSGRQNSPGVAWSGKIYLTAWIDYRASTPSIFVARFNADGTPLDPVGQRVATLQRPTFIGSGASLYNLRLSFGAGVFFVSWFNPQSFGSDYFGLRIADDGTPIDSAPLYLSSPESPPDVVVNSKVIAIASLQRVPGGFAPTVQVVKATGGDAVGPVVPLTPGTPDWAHPLIASDGNDFLVTFERGGTNLGYAIGLDSNGAPLSDKLEIIGDFSTGQDERLIFSNGRYYWVFTQPDRDNNGNNLGVLKLVDFPASRSDAGKVSTFTVRNGIDELLAVAADTDAPWFLLKRLNGEGDCLMHYNQGANSSCIALPAGASALPLFESNSNNRLDTRAIGVGPTGVLYAYTSGATSYDQGGHVRGALVPKANAALDAGAVSSFPVARTGLSEGSPTIAADSNGYLVAWLDGWSATRQIDLVADITGMRGEGVRVRAVHLSATGDVDSDFVTLSSDNAVSVSDVQSVFDGKKTFVVWHERRDDKTHYIMGRSVDGSVRPLQLGASLALTSAFDAAIDDQNNPSTRVVDPAVTFDGINRVVVWTRSLAIYRGQTAIGDIFGARVAADDTVVDAKPVAISLGTFTLDSRTPSIVYDESVKESVVAWSQQEQATLHHIRGARIKQGEIRRVIGDTNDTGVFFLEQVTGLQFSPRLATDGKGHGIVVWNDLGGVQGEPTARVKLFNFSSPAAAAADKSIRLTELVGYQALPFPVYMNDNASFIIGWTSKADWSDSNIHAVALALDGRLLDSPPVPLFATSDDEVGVAFARSQTPASAALVFGELDLNTPTEGATRLRFARVSSGKLIGESCAAEGECATRYCVGESNDKVCCDSPCTDTCGTCTAVSKRGTCTPRGDSARACGERGASRCLADSFVCPSSCVANGDCAANSVCQVDPGTTNGYCTPFVSTCASETAIKTISGDVVECADHLRCVGGSCLPQCRTNDDCVTSCTGADCQALVCDFGGKCVPAPVIVNDSGSLTGCTCDLSNRGAPSWPLAVLSVAVFAVYRRRRQNT